MNVTGQRICAMAGSPCRCSTSLLFIGLARFQLPPPPTASPDEISQMFAGNRTGIRVGLTICMLTAGLVLPWTVTLYTQLKRAEGESAPLAHVVLVAGPVRSFGTVYPLFSARRRHFRPDRPTELIYLLNNMAWLPWAGLTSYVLVSNLAMGLSILSDRRENLYSRGGSVTLVSSSG